MEITFLGTSGGILTAARSYPSILIDRTLLLDCGDGTTQRLMQLNALSSVNTICLSHLHGDHFMGITSLLWYYMFINRKVHLTIIGPSPIKEAVVKLLELQSIPPDFLVKLPFKLQFKELTASDDVFEVQGGYKIKYAEMDHTAPAFAYRIEKNGESVCYSGDSRPTQNLIELAEKSNIFICEATFSDDQKEIAYQYGHCTPIDAAKMARDAGCEKLVLTHISPPFAKTVNQSIDRLKDTFDKEILIAEDLMTLKTVRND
ncbi:MAG: MBL fold metallo-hydrolase [Promethearchaeota archaeon]